jgi:PAS domain-containing protein
MSARSREAVLAPAQWNYWAALLGAALVTTLVPWYLGVLDVDVRPTLRALLTGGALALGLMQLDLPKLGAAATAAPHVLGVLVLGAAWYLLGALAMPGFLILFAVPTYAVALECGRWTVATVAILTVVVAAAAALATSPELRWQLEQIDALAGWLPASLEPAGDVLRFASSTEGREQLAALAVFAVTIFAVAGVGASAAAVMRRQAHALERSDRAQRESSSLASKLLEDSTALEAIVFPSGRVHSVNRAFRDALGETRPGAGLLDVLRPVYPEPLARLLAAPDGGELAAQGCNTAGRRRLLDVTVRAVVLDGEPLRRVQLRSTAANDLAAAALDTLAIAVAVLGPDKTVAFANDAFRAHFPRAAAGAPAAEALEERHGLPSRWWDIAPSASARVRFAHDEQRCLARITLAGTHADHALTSIEIETENAS